MYKKELSGEWMGGGDCSRQLRPNTPLRVFTSGSRSVGTNCTTFRSSGNENEIRSPSPYNPRRGNDISVVSNWVLNSPKK